MGLSAPRLYNAGNAITVADSATEVAAKRDAAIFIICNRKRRGEKNNRIVELASRMRFYTPS